MKAIYRFSVFILISLLLFRALNPAFVSVLYYSGSHLVTVVLCENKDKPELKCHGKCQVKKAISQETAQSDDETVVTVKGFEIASDNERPFFSALSTVVIRNSFVAPTNDHDAFITFYFSVDHPPEA